MKNSTVTGILAASPKQVIQLASLLEIFGRSWKARVGAGMLSFSPLRPLTTDGHFFAASRPVCPESDLYALLMKSRSRCETGIPSQTCEPVLGSLVQPRDSSGVSPACHRALGERNPNHIRIAGERIKEGSLGKRDPLQTTAARRTRQAGQDARGAGCGGAPLRRPERGPTWNPRPAASAHRKCKGRMSRTMPSIYSGMRRRALSSRSSPRSTSSSATSTM
jgi:hypothetical protein